MGTTTAATPKKEETALDKATGKLIDLATGQAQNLALMGLKALAGAYYESRRAICEDDMANMLEKTICLAVGTFAGVGPGGPTLDDKVDKVISTLDQVNSNVNEIKQTVNVILTKVNLVRLDIAQLAVAAPTYKAIQDIQIAYEQFQRDVKDLKDKDCSAFFSQVLTGNDSLPNGIKRAFNALTNGLDGKPSLTQNTLQHIEQEAPNSSLRACYHLYQEWINSILLDLGKGKVVIEAALVYFKAMEKHGKSPKERPASEISLEKWHKDWNDNMTSLLNHYNNQWDLYVLNRYAARPEDPDPPDLSPTRAQGINPFFFPDDARETFRSADAFCCIQSNKYGLRGRIFSLGGTFKGGLKFKSGEYTVEQREDTIKIDKKLDYWTASQPGVYDKVDFSDEWTVHHYLITAVKTGVMELDVTLPYTPPPIRISKSNPQTLQPPKEGESTVDFGSFVEIARAGGTFALLSGTWKAGRLNEDASNDKSTAKLGVLAAQERNDVNDFKIREGQVELCSVARPEVGVAKGGPMPRDLGKKDGWLLDGNLRIWRETDKKVQLPAAKPNQHVRVVWSLNRAPGKPSIISANDFNICFRKPTDLLAQKETITEDALRRAHLAIRIDYSTVEFDMLYQLSGCLAEAGFRFYPVWNDQPSGAFRNARMIYAAASVNTGQAGVFKEKYGKDKDGKDIIETVVSQRLDPLPVDRKVQFRFESFYNLRIENSGLAGNDFTPFVVYARGEIENCYLELNPGSEGVGVPLPPGELTFTKMLGHPIGECCAFDYDRLGKADNVLFLDPSYAYVMAYGHVGAEKFARRPLVWGADRTWEMKKPEDRAFPFDLKSTGRLDHIVFYRPGGRKASIFRNDDGVMERVWTYDGGFPSYPMDHSQDEGFAFDAKGTGKLDHLVFHSPGKISVLHWDGASFVSLYNSSSQLGDYRLGDNDRAFAFDYQGNGKSNHIVIYRPMQRLSSILRAVPQHHVIGFDTVYASNTGLGDWDLGNPADRVLAFDCHSTGQMDYLVAYRPGKGAIYVFGKNETGNFVYPHKRGDGGPGAHGIAGFSLDRAGDRIAAIDYTGSGRLDHLLLYGLGTGHYCVAKRGAKKDDNSYEFVKVGEG
jgi:hypothetical protein